MTRGIPPIKVSIVLGGQIETSNKGDLTVDDHAFLMKRLRWMQR
jgi:hypothetical protein